MNTITPEYTEDPTDSASSSVSSFFSTPRDVGRSSTISARHSAARTSVVFVNTTSYVLAVDGSPIGLAAPLTVLPIVGAVVLWIIAARAATGAIGPNRLAGLRTRATMASPEAWVAGNRAARAGIQTAAVILGVTGVAVGVLAWTTDLLPLILLVGLALMFGALIRGCILGNRAAQKVNSDSLLNER
ncbi:MAG: hypothetical protein ACI8Y4_004910 [Candidatus Poriferisodalaceae bacterium]|jgi:hypothetical protein